MINDAQARQILQTFDTNPKNLQAMQAIGKALSYYGYPGAAGVAYGDNNWYDVPGGVFTSDGSNGPVTQTCFQDSVRFPLIDGNFVCHRVFYSPEEGIAAALANVWFPQQADGTGGPELARFVAAVDAGDTATIAQMVVPRAWGIARRGVAFSQLGENAATVLAGDIYEAAQQIATNLNEPLYLKPPPSTGVPTVASTFRLPTELLATLFPLPPGTALPSPPAANPDGKQNNAGGAVQPAASSSGISTPVKLLLVVGGLFGAKKLYDTLK